MTNIDFFKQDVTIGDIVIIELTSGKSVTGKVLEINDCVVIEKVDGKRMRLLDGIIGGWVVESHQEMPETKVQPETKTEVSTGDKSTTSSYTQTEVKKESQYGLTILGKIDLSEFGKPKKLRNKNSKKLESKQPVENSSQQKNKMTYLGNGFEALAQLNMNTSPKGKVLSLTPMGMITKIGLKFGVIFDLASLKLLSFDVKDLIGELADFSEKDFVVYSIIPNLAYAQALKITNIINILKIDEILSTSRTYLESGDYKNTGWAKSLISYVLKEYPHNVEAGNLMKDYFGFVNLATDVTKPSIVTARDTIDALPLKLPRMSEPECKDKERELGLLIRKGQCAECLQKSYELLHKYCPTPKYLKSYLNRIVNIEVTLGHTQEAIEALGQLIAYGETQDPKATNLAHLYIFLGRLLKQQGLYSEAIKALDCAQVLTPGPSVEQRVLRCQIKQELKSKEIKDERLVRADWENKSDIDV